MLIYICTMYSSFPTEEDCMVLTERIRIKPVYTRYLWFLPFLHVYSLDTCCNNEKTRLIEENMSKSIRVDAYILKKSEDSQTKHFV